MKRIVLFLIVVVGISFIANTANATIIFEDDFEYYSIGYNLTSLTRPGESTPTWIASDGTFDVIGLGSGPYDYFSGAYGKYLDLDGGSQNASDIYSSGRLEAGTYLLSFDLAGNHRNDDFEQVEASVAIAGYSELFTLEEDEGFTTFTREFTVDTAQEATLMFASYGGDNVGMLLDNVKIQSVVPEPATLVLFGVGLVGMCFRGKR